MRFHPAYIDLRFWILCLVSAYGLAACTHVAPRGAAVNEAKPVRRVALAPSYRQEVVLFSLGLLDVAYTFGGRNPATGLDCSGMVSYVFEHSARVYLPHSAAQIAQLVRPVSAAALQAGDLVFFNTTGVPNSHMGIFLGEGRFLHAASSGKVRVDLLSSAYYKVHFTHGGSLFDKEAGEDAPSLGIGR